MRVLLAVDGSAGSNDAARLVRALPWPARTVIHLVSVVDPGAWIPPGPGVPGNAGLSNEREVAAFYHAQQLAVSAELDSAGLEVSATVVSGRPADAICDEASRVEADVVVVGSRGHGKIAALLLGSVSATIVDRAPCPVLVARRTSLRRAVLAVDGSASAGLAAQAVATWPAFGDVPISVVTVAEAARPWTSGISPAFVAHARKAHLEDLRSASSEARDIAEEAAAGLREAGRSASVDVRGGQVPEQIIVAAEEAEADMLAIGCRGRSTLGTILLGSVARDVLLATTASVLIVRDRTGRVT